MSRLDAQQEIERLAGVAGLVVRCEARFLEYIRPNMKYRQQA